MTRSWPWSIQSPTRRRVRGVARGDEPIPRLVRRIERAVGIALGAAGPGRIVGMHFIGTQYVATDGCD